MRDIWVVYIEDLKKNGGHKSCFCNDVGFSGCANLLGHGVEQAIAVFASEAAGLFFTN